VARQRIGNQLGAAERDAAQKAAAHANTPAVAHLDALGRTFLMLANNGPDPAHPGQDLHFANRIELDIEGNQRAARDADTKARDPKATRSWTNWGESSTATTTTCWAAPSTSPAWRPANAGC